MLKRCILRSGGLRPQRTICLINHNGLSDYILCPCNAASLAARGPRRSRYLLTILLIVDTFNLYGAYIGPVGASTFACLSLDSVPSPGFNVSFNSGEHSSCMTALGHGATMSVTQPGITCTCIGFVAKGLGTCWLRKFSSWGLSYFYAFEDMEYYMQTSSDWYASSPFDNAMSLKDEERWDGGV